MLNLIKRIWQNGEVVNAEKMNTISSDLDAIESEVNGFSSGVVRGDIAQTAQTDAWRKQARENIQAGGTNPNLLDNPWFTVNQRGYSSYTAGYTVDRWHLGGYTQTINVTDDGISWSVANGIWFEQVIEDMASLDGKTLTLSAIINGNISSVTFLADMSQSSGYIIVPGTNIYLEFNPLANHVVRLVSYETSTTLITLRAVKLELGSVSTLANDGPPDYTTELLKCQRYFVNTKNLGGCPLAYGIGNTTTNGRFLLKLNVPMRAAPSVSLASGNPHIIGEGVNMTISSSEITFVSTSKDNAWAGFHVNLTGSNTFVSNKIYALLVPDNFFLSADL